MKKQTKKGFTLVELVIVIAVIAILSAILIPTFGNVISDANKTAAKEDARTAYQNFLVDNAEDVSFAGDEAYLLVDVNLTNKTAKYAYNVKDGSLTELELAENETNFSKVLAGINANKPTTETTNLTALTEVTDLKTNLTSSTTKADTFGKAYKLTDKVYLVFASGK